MEAVRAALLSLAALGTLYYIVSTLALAAHFRSSRRDRRVQTPLLSVSVLKPASGIDRHADANFLSYLRQDYPDYEVIFGVLDPQDPAAALVRRLMAGSERSSLRTGANIDGANNKVRILHNLARQARGDVIVVTDADTRADPDLLARITEPFADGAVGAVTCLYRGVDAASTADALEGLHMSCIFAPGVACAEALGGIDFGLGAAIAIRRDALDRIGGFEAIVDYLADDFQLGRKAAMAGYTVVLSDYVMQDVLGGESLRSVLTRELRWSRTTRASRPWGHFGLVVTFGWVYALGFAAVSEFSALGWAVLGGVTMTRLATASLGARLLHDSEFTGRAHLLPLRDVLSFAIWIAGYFSNTVTWRKRRLRVMRDGTMRETRA